MERKILTTLVCEDGLADRAGPHPEAAELVGLRVARKMLPETAFVDVVLAADGTGMVGGTSFC